MVGDNKEVGSDSLSSRLKELVATAEGAVVDLDEPLKSIAFKEIVSALLSGKVMMTVGSSAESPASMKVTESPTSVPQVTASGLVDAIIQLLDSPWGKTPRTLSEIDDALRLNAIHYPTTSIAARLNELTKRGKLRRLKEGPVLQYVLSTR